MQSSAWIASSRRRACWPEYDRWIDGAAQFERLLAILMPRFEYVLRMRCGPEEKTLHSIAVELGVSTERVRQMEARALRQIRKTLGEREALERRAKK